jgi:hypothetical protein
MLALLIISMQAAPISLGQALAAEVGRVLQALPAAFGVLAEGLLEAGRGGDLAVLPGRRVLVALPVQRRDHALVELGALLQHGLRRVEAGVLEAGHLRDLVDAGQVLHVEQHVLDGGDVAHGVSWEIRYPNTKMASRTMRPFQRVRCQSFEASSP